MARTSDITEIDLARFNKWWFEDFPSTDPEITKYVESQFKWEPRTIKTFCDEDCFFTLRGPRRVGKTTLLKLIILSLLEKGQLTEPELSEEECPTDVAPVPPKNVFYFPCDYLSVKPFDEAEDLPVVIQTYLKHVKIPNRRAYLLIDEITSVHNWQSLIKPLKDSGELQDCTIIFTASHIIDVKKERQALLGRHRESGPCDPWLKTLLQPKFSEYVETLNRSIHAELQELGLRHFNVRRAWLLEIINGEIPSDLRDLNLKYDAELEKLLSDYLLTGGFPQAVHQYVSSGRIHEQTYFDFVGIVMDDLTNWKKSAGTAKRLLARITDTITTPVSYSKLLDKIKHQTVKSYCEVLSETYLINCHYQIDLSKKTPRAKYGSNKKFYIRDPFMFHACRAVSANVDDPFEYSREFVNNETNRGCLLESLFSDHLSRFAFQEQSKSPHFNPSASVYYAKTKSKKEADFLTKLDGKYLPIEVKDTNSIGTSETESIRGLVSDKHLHNRGIVTSKNKFDIQERYAIVPARMLLLLI